MPYVEVRINKKNGAIQVSGKEFQGSDHEAIMQELTSRLGEIVEQSPDHEHHDHEMVLEGH